MYTLCPTVYVNEVYLLILLYYGKALNLDIAPLSSNGFLGINIIFMT